MENLIKNKIPNFLTNKILQYRHYSIAERYFYFILYLLHNKYANKQGRFIGHDTAIRNGIPSFRSFGLSQRICKSSRKKLRNDGLIIHQHIYSEKGHRVGTEYAFCEAAFRESPKEIHDLIFNKRLLELSTPERLLY